MSDIHWFQEMGQISQLLLQTRERTAGELMEVVRRSTGLADFGPEPVEDALGRLLNAYRADGRLNLLGRLATHWDNLRLMTNRLILRERELADPSIALRPVEAPIFVMGLPRSGTTFLHRLLDQDPDNQTARSWRVVYPYPDHPASGRGAGASRVQSEFSLFKLLSPNLERVHPIDAHAPQECADILAHSFRSLRFDSTYDTPSYRRWLRQADWRDAYGVHRRFLQHLQGEQPRRWVLKSPDHVFALSALRAVYPDARIVFSHRDPLKVLPSLAFMTEAMRKPFVRGIDRAALGRQVADDWADGVRRMIAAAAAWPSAQVFHVHFKALTEDPLGVVERLYEHFGLPLGRAARAGIGGFAARNPNGGYGRNVYRLGDYGLDPRAEREVFSDYVSRFGVAEEVAV